MSERWVRCEQGHRHWGAHGAAGLLLRHRPGGARCWVLLQLRASWTHHGGTWGVPGGARRDGESAVETALRETGEELHVDLGSIAVTGCHVDDHGGWSYVTVLADAPGCLPAAPRGAESAAARWIDTSAVAGLELHPGFAASWPLLAGPPAEPAR